MQEYIEATAISFSVVFIDNNEIDKNILNARLDGFHNNR